MVIFQNSESNKYPRYSRNGARRAEDII